MAMSAPSIAPISRSPGCDDGHHQENKDCKPRSLSDSTLQASFSSNLVDRLAPSHTSLKISGKKSTRYLSWAHVFFVVTDQAVRKRPLRRPQTYPRSIRKDSHYCPCMCSLSCGPSLFGDSYEIAQGRLTSRPHSPSSKIVLRSCWQP